MDLSGPMTRDRLLGLLREIRDEPAKQAEFVAAFCADSYKKRQILEFNRRRIEQLRPFVTEYVERRSIEVAIEALDGHASASSRSTLRSRRSAP